MSFLSGNKLLLGAVGIALSSAAAVGYVVGYCVQKKRSDAVIRTMQIGKNVPSYVMENGMRELPPLKKLREVRICFSYSF